MTPDIRDLDNLLQQIYERHRAFFYVMGLLSALGVVGALCLLRVIH